MIFLFFFSELSGLGGSGIGSRYPLSPKGSDLGEQYRYTPED